MCLFFETRVIFSDAATQPSLLCYCTRDTVRRDLRVNTAIVSAIDSRAGVRPKRRFRFHLLLVMESVRRLRIRRGRVLLVQVK